MLREAEMKKKVTLKDIEATGRELLKRTKEIEDLNEKLKEPQALLRALKKQAGDDESFIIEGMKELSLTAVAISREVMKLVQEKAYSRITPPYQKWYEDAMGHLKLLDESVFDLLKKAGELEIELKKKEMKDAIQFVKEAAGVKALINKVVRMFKSLVGSLTKAKDRLADFKDFLKTKPKEAAATAESVLPYVISDISEGRQSISEAADRILEGGGRLEEQQIKMITTRKDFDALARKLRKNNTKTAVVNVFVDFFKDLYPKFDANRFFSYAGLKDIETKE